MDSLYIHVIPTASVLKPRIPKLRNVWTVTHLGYAWICSVIIAIIGIHNSNIHRRNVVRGWRVTFMVSSLLILVLVNHHRWLWHPLGHILSVDIVLWHHVQMPVVVDWGAHVGLLDGVVRHRNHMVIRYMYLVVLVWYADLSFLLTLP